METFEKLNLFIRWRPHMLMSFEDGIRKVLPMPIRHGLNGGISKAERESYAFLWDRTALDYRARQAPCTLQLSADSFGINPLSVLLRKNSPYTKVLGNT